MFMAAVRKTPIRLLREHLHRQLLIAVNSGRFFVRILRGNFHDLNHAPIWSKWAFILHRPRHNQAFVDYDLPSAENVWTVAKEVYSSRQIWPISFSYPLEAKVGPAEKSGGLSPVFPGHSYSFSDPDQYIQSYGAYDFALTHKKAGWDCFRHLEICFSGAIPYMPDATLIPAHTMVHYPKEFLVRVADHLRQNPAVAEPKTKRALATYFNRQLTSRAMAEYVARVAPFLYGGRVLFVDEALVGMPDYQSVLTLIGLKQVLGTNVSVAHPVDYVYEDWDGDATTLYGRGFGYTRVLEPHLKEGNEISATPFVISRESLAVFDAIVVGSITRNIALARRLLDLFPAEKSIWIHGEDEGPTRNDIRSYREARVTAFAREL